MKRIILSVAVLATALANAQVGINEESPKATLDIKAKTDNTSDALEGLLVPRVDKEKALKMGGNSDIQESTMIYVNDMTFTDPQDGTEAKVADITEKGYYFWNGIKWVKTVGNNGVEWVYNPTNQHIELVRSGQGDFKNKVYFDEKGRYKVLPTDVTSYESYYGNTWVQSPLDVASSQILVRKTTKDMEYSPSNEKILNMSTLLLNDDASTPSNGTHTVNNSKAIVMRGNTQNYNSIAGAYLAVEHNGDGRVNSLKGSYSDAKHISGEVGSIYGATNQASTYAEAGADYMFGTTSNSAIRGNASQVGQTYGYYGGNTVINGNSSIGTMRAIHVYNTIFKDQTPTITEMTGIRYQVKKSDAAPVITNNYGLWLDDIEGGTDVNYAIYAGLGDIRFGQFKDDTATENRVVTVDNDGKLAIGGNVSDFVSLWANDTTNQLVKLKTTSDGTDRVSTPGATRNDVTISDAGKITAKGFVGYNGATIFPDYVFQKYYTGESAIKADYNFNTLEQVENFVKQNGHLPGYTSAKEIAEKGLIDLGATQLTNVEKIEELYLHTIEQEKEIKDLKELLNAQQQQIEDLKVLINK